MRINFVFFLILLQNLLFGQFFDGFDDNNLSNNPEWKGNLSHFIVDMDNKLRLNAPQEGTSWLYLNTLYPDSFELGMKIKMEFSPSSSNACEIFFLLDKEILNESNGYSLQLGENGSSDRIKVFKLENGQKTLLSQGLESALAKDPSICNIKLTFRNGKDFVLVADYDDNGSFDDTILFENSTSVSSKSIFGINCIYTSSRTDKFVFDDIYVKEFELDKTAPKLLDLSVVNSNEILLSFDENISKETAQNTNNYNVNNGIGSPIMAFYDELKPNQVLLSFDKNFSSTAELTLSITNLSDINGNIINQINKMFLYPAVPAVGDLILSEILFNPYTDAEDFIEVYNTSNNYIQLKGLVIKNLQNNQDEELMSSLIIEPKQYYAITENKEKLIEIYKPDIEARLIKSSLPSFNNDEGIVAIYNNKNELLDSFSYNENIHNPLIDDVEGVSLEKVNLVPFDNKKSNWQSSAKAVNYATPGYKNSNSITSIDISEEFKLEKKIFSPNGDSKDDILYLIYNLPQSGYIANIQVYSSEGYLVKNLTKNELLGTEGIISWDGSNEDGEVAKLGIYIIIGTLFDIEGNTKKIKKDCVLADFID